MTELSTEKWTEVGRRDIIKLVEKPLTDAVGQSIAEVTYDESSAEIRLSDGTLIHVFARYDYEADDHMLEISLFDQIPVQDVREERLELMTGAQRMSLLGKMFCSGATTCNFMEIDGEYYRINSRTREEPSGE